MVFKLLKGTMPFLVSLSSYTKCHLHLTCTRGKVRPGVTKVIRIYLLSTVAVLIAYLKSLPVK